MNSGFNTDPRVADQNRGAGSSRGNPHLPLKCFNCRETSHRKTSCQKRVIFSNDEVVHEDNDLHEHYQTEHDDLVSSDTRQLLVFRHALMSLQVIEESWLHNNIFRCYFTIRGKVCLFMIS